jgi:UDP-N-acetylmuramate--alanine ligase
MIGTMLMGSSAGGSTIVGTQVPQFDGSNIHVDAKSPWFAIEACEYKRSFLRYHPTITVITNIDLDHLDYYHDEKDYRSAFESILSQTSETVVLNGDCLESQKLTQLPPQTYVVYHDHYVDNTGAKHPFPKLQLQVPGEHLAFDAKLAFVVGIIVGLKEKEIIEKLEAYRGAWRRSEIVGTTANGNILMSDYGHHPSEIRPTLSAIKSKYNDKELVVVFQPHQYSRTRELLEEFAISFDDADTLIIPNIYFSRDKAEDVAWMTPEKFVGRLQQRYPKTVYGNGLSNTLKLLQSKDATSPGKLIILLLGAGDVDELRKELIPIK